MPKKQSKLNESKYTKIRTPSPVIDEESEEDLDETKEEDEKELNETEEEGDTEDDEFIEYEEPSLESKLIKIKGQLYIGFFSGDVLLNKVLVPGMEE